MKNFIFNRMDQRDLIVKSSPEQRCEREKTVTPRHALPKGFQVEGTANTSIHEGKHVSSFKGALPRCDPD